MAAALGDVGSRGGALGGDVDGGGARGARAVGGAGERTAGGRKGEGGRKLGNILGGPFVPGEATTRDKRTFCPGWWLHPGQKGGPFVPGEATTRDKRAFCTGSWLHPEQKMFLGGPGKFPAPQPTFSLGRIYHPGQKGPVFPQSRQIFCLFLVLFTSLLK